MTFFWNGNRGGPFNKDLEKHKEVCRCQTLDRTRIGYAAWALHTAAHAHKEATHLQSQACTIVTCWLNFLVHLQIRSDTGIAFNKKPEMKAKEIAETGVEALKSGQYHQVHPLTAAQHYVV